MQCNVHLVQCCKMCRRSKRRHSKTSFITHPRLDKVDVMTSICQQCESACFAVRPRPMYTVHTYMQRASSWPRMQPKYCINIYLVWCSEVFQWSKWRYCMTSLITHPHLYEVEIMATLCKQWERAWLDVTPIATDKRVRKMPKANLDGRQIYSSALHTTSRKK